MSALEVDGARLYYETRGDGPPMLLIPGANGDANVFESLADRLSADYLVTTYDRRGFSRSRLDGPQDYARRLCTDAADARHLIEHVAGVQKATVFGTSSGAVVALRLLLDHADVIEAAVLFEPAAMCLHPRGRQWIEFFGDVYDVYRRAGTDPALKLFRERTFPAVDHAVMQRSRNANSPHGTANAIYWFERELREYTSAPVNAEALRPWADRILPAVGRECRGYPNYEVSRRLGSLLDRDVVELPGGHVGFVTNCEAFADSLLARLHQAAAERRGTP
jgi:acetyltransferase/esterase